MWELFLVLFQKVLTFLFAKKLLKNSKNHLVFVPILSYVSFIFATVSVQEEEMPAVVGRLHLAHIWAAQFSTVEVVVQAEFKCQRCLVQNCSSGSLLVTSTSK